MSWIDLTDPAGNEVHLNTDHICRVRSAEECEQGKCLLDLDGGQIQAVKEARLEVMELIFKAERNDD